MTSCKVGRIVPFTVSLIAVLGSIFRREATDQLRQELAIALAMFHFETEDVESHAGSVDYDKTSPHSLSFAHEMSCSKKGSLLTFTQSASEGRSIAQGSPTLLSTNTMPIKKNQDTAEQFGKDKDGNQTSNVNEEKSIIKPHVGKNEEKQAQKPVKYDLDERPWPIC
jgi:hypothetical protein